MTSTTALQQFKVGTLNIEIHPDRESAGEAAAREAAQELTHLAQSADEFGVIFATGASQLRMLDALTSMRGLPWNKPWDFTWMNTSACRQTTRLHSAITCGRISSAKCR